MEKHFFFKDLAINKTNRTFFKPIESKYRQLQLLRNNYICNDILHIMMNISFSHLFQINKYSAFSNALNKLQKREKKRTEGLMNKT